MKLGLTKNLALTLFVCAPILAGATIIDQTKKLGPLIAKVGSCALKAVINVGKAFTRLPALTLEGAKSALIGLVATLISPVLLVVHISNNKENLLKAALKLKNVAQSLLNAIHGGLQSIIEIGSYINSEIKDRSKLRKEAKELSVIYQKNPTIINMTPRLHDLQQALGRYTNEQVIPAGKGINKHSNYGLFSLHRREEIFPSADRARTLEDNFQELKNKLIDKEAFKIFLGGK